MTVKGVEGVGVGGRWGWGWSVGIMKVISYNARGLAVVRKRWRFDINPRKKFFCGVYSGIKVEFIDNFLIKSIWGDAPCDYSYQPSVGASGGLITMWDKSLIDVCSSMSFAHVIVVSGRVILTGEDVVVVNVYAPCEQIAKRDLWDRLVPLVMSKNDSCLCLCGHFNSVRSIDERKGRKTVFRQMEANLFNKFINDSLLLDLPICGRLFTWYPGDGVSMSRLDRFLLYEKWCEVWPNCIQDAC